MKTILAVAFIGLLLGVTTNVSLAQKQAKLLKSTSSITISGTSSLHNWEEKVLLFDGDLFITAAANKLTGINNGLLVCKVKSIDGGKSLMNSKTYESLKAESFPEISFTIKNIDQLKATTNSYNCTIIGNITLAGITKQISIPVIGTLQNNNLTMKGSTNISLPDFNITPPTALMGTIKTGKTVTVTCSFAFVL